ncbi:MAG: GNAT family N-acetyltransferase [Mesorhizobium sp.]|nr:N-acetyltransferase [bacterium M00.F.Ca.ET.205.01.1.1]TGU55720.1 N-acetyltransferase [bacterium M00.F.Ca.ET.152.01.1.1]TGV40005.1 N-acetyltransferase [Mesorhizobium sp. M00.F.Ca.ET.186.01.1.1]TGZ44988.1 N-acetyltransferase [bacterium M00.F.Ca.ET.162.01.1.1]TJW31981.1 MAG: GNAT family N-acetyltransferase [Mesorhizobium sp.]
MTNRQATTAPVIETQRTILRAHRLDDFDAYVTMWSDAGVTRFIGGKPRTREESWMRFLRHAGLWSLLGYGFWAIEEKATGRFIGEAGFHDLKRDMEPSIEGIPEAGWALAPTVHGAGFATEVVGRVLAWGEETLGRARTVCIIDPQNTASLNVATKCGYSEVTRLLYHDKPTILLERLP